MARTPKLFTVIVYRPSSDVQKLITREGIDADAVAALLAEHERGEFADATFQLFAGLPLRVEVKRSLLIGEPRKRTSKPAPEAPRKPGRPPGSRNKSKVAPAPEATATAKGAA